MSSTYALRRAAPVGARLSGFGWRPVSRRREVITGLELRIEPGERVLLAGPSGAGKSTVLQALAGVLGTTATGELTGRVDVDGRIGLLQQNPLASTVADRIGRDVAFGLENAGVARSELWPAVEAAVEAVRLPYPLEHPTQALSGGERQRLALAGVLAMRPGMLLLDEPTSMLDDETAASVRGAVLESVRHTGATLVVVEHRIEPWLDEVDRVVVLDDGGNLIADCSPVEFVSEHSADLAASGVWMPGLDAPTPVRIPTTLVEPREQPVRLAAKALHVDLRTRTMRGTVTANALRGVDVELSPARLTALTGPSGSGKSTLVAACAGLLAPTSGTVDAGESMPPHRWHSAHLARRIGWVPQAPEHGFLTTRVRDEVEHTAHHLGIEVDGESLLELFGLSALAGANPYQLSGGEQRRLALVAALAHRPAAVLLDEPTVGQDRNTWSAAVGWMVSARAAGAATAVATHDAELIALADTAVHLRDGFIE